MLDLKLDAFASEKGEKSSKTHFLQEDRWAIADPQSNGNPPSTEAILKSLEKFFFIFYIGSNRNLPVTDKNGWSLEIR